jgi:hypothetical protein
MDHKFNNTFIRKTSKLTNSANWERYPNHFSNTPRSLEASLRVGDTKISRMEDKLGEDLEIINDGEFRKLRRKSSYLIPTFCFYLLQAHDLLNILPIGSDSIIGWNEISHYFDNRIFTGFVDDSVRNTLASADRIYSMLAMQVEPFKNKVCFALARNEIENGFIRHVNYTEFAKEEFFIEPTEPAYDANNGWDPKDGTAGAEAGVAPRTLYYLNDALGSAVGLIEKDGRVSSRYHYDEFGTPLDAKKFDMNWPGPAA